MNDDEKQLREAFEALRAHDRANVPSFARMRQRSEERRRGARTGPMFAAAFAAAALALLALWVGWPSEEPVIELAAEPLGFLLEPPSASVIASEAPIDQIEEAW
jgi:hypothetical protein